MEGVINTFIKINGVYFKVVGVYEQDANGGFEGENSAFIPFDTFQQVGKTEAAEGSALPTIITDRILHSLVNFHCHIQVRRFYI